MNVRTNQRRSAGFTLIELSVVMLIIGLMVTFLLVASYEGVQRANERATQALILKLDTALSDRVDALASLTPPVSTAHRFLSQVDVPAGGPLIPSEERALVIARLDFLRAELPDVFFVQADANYPLNFCGQAYNPNGTAVTYLHYMLPLGVGLAPPEAGALVGTRIAAEATPHNEIDGRPQTGGSLAGRGIFGANYGIAAGLYKQLGYSPQGCNGLDDSDPPNGYIDERAEGNIGLTAQEVGQIDLRLANHKHETARSEMLYAILVEGQGPLGSFFTIEDFTAAEVGDTDQDGLNEFLDAWGKPLQFFRWPVYLVSDVGSGRSFQVGLSMYNGVTASRDQNALDPSQQLMTPSWWANLAALAGPQTSAMMSPRARVVHQHFIGLVDPLADYTAGPGQYWDRNGFYKRRAYFSKFLIASGGPDLNLGVGRFEVDYSTLNGVVAPYTVAVDQAIPIPTGNRDLASFQLTAIEGQAGRSDLFFRASPDPGSGPPYALGTTTGANAGAASLFQAYGPPPVPPPPPNPIDVGIRDLWATDDITNHTLGSASTGVR